MTKRHQAVPTPDKGLYAWGVKDNKTGQVRDPGASKQDAKENARDWNRGRAGR